VPPNWLYFSGAVVASSGFAAALRLQLFASNCVVAHVVVEAAVEVVPAALGDERIGRRRSARTPAGSRRQHLDFLHVSTFMVPMIAPLERVRVAIAPSMVIRFSALRLPLMLKPPVVRLSRSFCERPASNAGLQHREVIGVAPVSAQVALLELDRFAVLAVELHGVERATTVTDSLRRRSAASRRGRLCGRVQLHAVLRPLLETSSSTSTSTRWRQRVKM